MRRKPYLILLLLFLWTTMLHAQNHGFGIGVILGEPTGISAKRWLTRTTAADFAAAWSFEGGNAFALHADYLLHNFRLIKVAPGQLPLYYGIGSRLKFNDDGKNDNKKAELGVRVPVGLNYHFKSITLDAFVEIVPILELAPETDFLINAAVGVRYFFE